MKKQRKRILITGGAGFVGANLGIALAEKYKSLHIIALDNLKRRGSELNIDRLTSSGIDFIRGDVRNLEDLQSVGEVDTIIECSAEPSVLSGYNESPEYLINTNLVGAINCLEIARKYKSDFIFLSTSRIYPIEGLNAVAFQETKKRFKINAKQKIAGVSRKGISEKFPIEGPRSLYGSTKLSAELLIQEYIDAYGIRGVINRCGVIAGPWQMGKVDQGFVALWVASHFFGKKLNYIGFDGSGKQVRDVLHVKDLIRLVDMQLSNLDKVNGEIFNVGGGDRSSTSLLELTEMCNGIIGKKIKIGKVKRNRKADIRMYVSDCTKINKALKWKPKYAMEDIVEDTFKWISDNRDKVEPILS